MDDAAILEWLGGKLFDAEGTLRAREQSAESWATGTEAEWKQAAGLTGNRPPKPAERQRQAGIQRRIAEKTRKEIEMIKATIAAVERGRGFARAWGRPSEGGRDE